MAQVKLGIIGLGNMGRNHLRIAANLSNLQLVGGSDADAKAGQEACRKVGAMFFADSRELIRACDALVVCSPTLTHAEVGGRCLEMGKHVFIEKPLAVDAAQAVAFAGRPRSPKQVVQVGHVERFNPVFTELTNILQTEKVLAISCMRMSPFSKQAADVSVTYDLMIHDFDLLLALFGVSLEQTRRLKLSAFGLAKGGEKLNYLDVHGMLPNGVLAHLTASKITLEKVRQYLITCESSYIVADFLAKSIHICRHQTSDYVGERSNVKYRQASLVERVLVPNVEPLQAEMADFVECVRTGRPPKVGIDDAVRALTLADLIEANVCR